MLLFIFGATNPASLLYAQATTILRVRVTDSISKQPVAYAIVSTRNLTTSGFVFQQSDDGGYAELTIATGHTYRLDVNALGYLPYRLALENVVLESTINVPLTMADNSLQEILVRDSIPAISYRPDTVTYHAAAFATGNERKLNELIEQLPGLAIDDELNITYQGKPVKTLLVENKLFFGGDNELALKGLPAGAVGKVQVFEDYQPMGFSTDPFERKEIALNILLKEDRKNVYFGEIEALAGPPQHFFVKVDAFRFNKRSNIYAVSGANNTNSELLSVRSIIRLLNGGGGFSMDNFNQFSTVSNALYPALSPREINQYLATLGGNLDLGKRSTMNFFALLPRQVNTEENLVRTDIALLDGNRLRETLFNTDNTKTTTAIGQVNLKTLYDKKFLTTDLQINRSQEKETNFSDYSSSVAVQSTDETTNKLNQEITLNVKYGWEPKSRQKLLASTWVNYSSTQDTNLLKSDQPLLLFLSSGQQPPQQYEQLLMFNQRQLGGEVIYNHPLSTYFSAGIEVNAKSKQLNQQLNGSSGFEGDAKWTDHQFVSRSQLMYRRGELLAQLGLAYQYNHWRIANQLADARRYFRPHLYVSGRLSPSSLFTINAKEDVVMPGEMQFSPLSYVTGPRTIRLGTSLLQPQRNRSASINYQYSNPVKQLNFQLYASAERQLGPQLITAFDLREASRIVQYRLLDQNTTNWLLRAQGRFTFAKGQVILNLRLRGDEQLLINNNAELLTHSLLREVKLSWKMKVTKVVRFNTKTTAGWSTYQAAVKFSSFQLYNTTDVDFDLGPLDITLTTNLDRVKFEEQKNLRSTIALSALYAFDDHPLALSLRLASPIGPAEDISYLQNDLIFQENIDFILPAFATAGVVLQF